MFGGGDSSSRSSRASYPSQGNAAAPNYNTTSQAPAANATGQLDQDTLAAMNLGVAPNNAQQQGSQRYGSNSAPNYNPPPNTDTTR